MIETGTLVGSKKRDEWDGMPSTRLYWLRFLWSVIWKTDALPWL